MPDASRAVGAHRARRHEPVDHGGLRRSVLLTLASAVLPGSGLLPTSRRRWAMALLPIGLVVVLFALWGATFGRRTFRDWLLATSSLQVVAVVLALCAVVWLVSIVLTLVTTRPRTEHWRSAVAIAVTVALALVVCFPLGLAANYAMAQRSLIKTVFGSVDDKKSGTVDYGAIQKDDPFEGQDRINVLLLGGDGGADRLGVRTDTMIVASVDTHTGNTVLLSLPRNLIHVPLPKGSPLAKAYGDEFWGAGPEGDWMLNAMYRLVPANHPDIYADSDNPGADVLKVTIGGILGLDIDYYALVELSGFKKIIDALGGITVNINYRIPIGGNTDLGIPPTHYLEPGPEQHLTGDDALWYARGRYGVIGGDYSRMDRQRCFIDAMVAQVDPATLLLKYQKLAAATKQILRTDIPESLLPALVDLGLEVKNATMTSIVFTPEVYGSYSDPDYSIIKAQTQKAIKKSERQAGASADVGEETASPGATETPAPTRTPGPAETPAPTDTPTATPPADDGIAEDTADSCAYQPVSTE